MRMAGSRSCGSGQAQGGAGGRQLTGWLSTQRCEVDSMVLVEVPRWCVFMSGLGLGLNCVHDVATMRGRLACVCVCVQVPSERLQRLSGVAV